MAEMRKELMHLRKIHMAACDVRMAETDREFAMQCGGLIKLRDELRAKLDAYHEWLEEGLDCRSIV